MALTCKPELLLPIVKFRVARHQVRPLWPQEGGVAQLERGTKPLVIVKVLACSILRDKDAGQISAAGDLTDQEQSINISSAGEAADRVQVASNATELFWHVGAEMGAFHRRVMDVLAAANC
jgi:hypothetical protein